MSRKWDKRFMDLARVVSTWSKDPDHKIGAVLTDSSNRVLSLGYNGPPKNIIDSGLPEERKRLRTIHAELNAILNCSIPHTATSLYIYPYAPCAQCAAAILQTNIARVLYAKELKLSNWKASQDEAIKMLNEGGIDLIEFSQFPQSLIGVFWDDKY